MEGIKSQQVKHEINETAHKVGVLPLQVSGSNLRLGERMEKKKESEEGERERRNKGTKNEVKEKGKRKIEDGK